MNWFALFQPFLELSILRTRPQDLPVSRVLLGLTATVFALVGLFANFMWLALPLAFVATLVEATILVAFVTLVLRYMAHPERTGQTLTAMFGYSAVLGFLLLPISAWLVSAQDAKALTATHQFVILAVLAWDTVIRGHIFRHAFECTMGAGLVISLVYFFVHQGVVQYLIRSLTSLAPAAQ